MVGVGWLLVIDDWLTRGGPGGAMLGFLLGGIALIPVAYVYGKFVREIPDASSEIAYTTAVFPKLIGFLAGWLMTLAYLIVCPWEAVAIGKILGYIFPAIRTFEIYRVGNFPVFLPALIVGIGLTAFIIFLNYRGIRLSSRFQNYTTFGLLTLFAIFCLAGVTRMNPQNMQPFFSQTASSGWLAAATSIILVLQIVPYFLTGFESVPKCSEESDENFQSRNFAKSIYLGLSAGIVFYVLIIGVVSGLVPWQSLANERYATVLAFHRAFHSQLFVQLILIAALFSLLKVFNANFLTASRLVFALGRRNLIPPSMGEIHPRYQSPGNAVIFCGVVTLIGALLGDSLLIPVTEVGSMCSALGWSVTCLAFLKFRKGRIPKDRLIAITGAAVALLFLLLKLIPQIPGSFGRWEYVALSLWLVFGFTLHALRARPFQVVSTAD
jgi:amino acid transporter